MKEAEGCALLKERFTRAGFQIAENVPLTIGDATVNLDGWDAERHVGYEYITAEAGDDAEFTPEVIDDLEARMEKGELHVFLIDEHAGAEILAIAADGFLATVAGLTKPKENSP